MLIDIEYMVCRQLEEKLEDLYTEMLGDECPLVVEHIGMEDTTAVIVFVDYDFPNYRLVLAESLNLDNPMIQMQLQIKDYQLDDERDKFLRKHKRTFAAMKEFWKIEFEVI